MLLSEYQYLYYAAVFGAFVCSADGGGALSQMRLPSVLGKLLDCTLTQLQAVSSTSTVLAHPRPGRAVGQGLSMMMAANAATLQIR